MVVCFVELITTFIATTLQLLFHIIFCTINGAGNKNFEERAKSHLRIYYESAEI